MIRHPVSVFESYREEFGPTFSFHFGGAQRAIATTEPELIDHVLRARRDNYQKSAIQVERMAEFQGKGLVNSHGPFWTRQRRLLAQAFRRKRLAGLLPIQQAVLDELLSGFDKAARVGPVDIYGQMVLFTLKLVGKSLFGRSMGDGDLQQIGDTISTIQSFIVRQIVQPYLIWWFRLSGQTASHQDLRHAADAVVMQHIATRRGAELTDDDLLRLLLETTYHDNGETMSDEMVKIESLQLMVAGNETSSIALSWTFYLLARHPEYIGRIRDELDEVIGDGPVDFAALHRLQFTVQVIDEAMRLYPPFWMIDRIALADDEFNGLRIPAGVMVIPYLYGTHRNPATWPDPDAFDPGRFEPERAKDRHPFAFIPFGGGPRVCIGASMAVMQMLMIVATFVSRYDFELVDDAPMATQPMMLLRPGGPIMMRFRPVASAARRPSLSG